MKTRGIYAIVHIASGRAYIGSSSDIDLRLRMHAGSLERGRHYNRFLQRAWTKNGASAFEMRVLELTGDASLVVREQAHLDQHQPNVFNIGVVADCPWRGQPRSAEHTEKLAASRRGRPHPYSDEQRRKIIASNKARTGQKMSATAIAKMSAAKLGRTPPPITAETRAKFVSIALSREYSSETRRKMSESARRRGNCGSHDARVAGQQRRRQREQEASA